MHELTRREALRLAAAVGAGVALGSTAPAFGRSVGTYDDGGDAIPGGITGDPDRVIVIGAGWAGLTAANALRNAGVEHVVLEGRGRIGGRARTKQIGGCAIDVGCSWIHSPIGNPLAAYADQAGVKRTPADVELDAPLFRFHDASLGRELDLIEKGQAFVHLLNFAQNDAAAIADEIGPRASIQQGCELYLNRNRVGGTVRRATAFMVRVFSEMTYGHDWAGLSLAAWAWGNAESDYSGVGQGDFPVGGYRRLYDAMAGTGEVRLRHRVEAIELTKRGVRVRGRSNGKRFTVRGSHVLVTVPLGVLKHRASLRFDPGLPAAKRAAIKGTGFGVIEKIAMVFEEPFWNDLTHTHATYISATDVLEFPYFVDLKRIAGQPALIAFNGGPFARMLDNLDRPLAFEACRRRMTEVFGREIPDPVDYAVTNWRDDRFSRGSYSNILVGRSADDMDVLAEPVAGRILFAGEATNRRRHSTADGAFSSGIREAKRLLQQPSVQLSAG